MSYLVKRLRNTVLYYGSGKATSLGEEAADYIEELKAQIVAKDAELDLWRKGALPAAALAEETE
jgi:hypothetical protein